MTELTPQGRYAQIAREDGRGAVVTILEGPGAGAKMLVEPDGTRRGSLGSPELDDEGARHADELMWSERSEQRDNLFIDVTFPAPRLIIFGAIDFAAQLCTLARTSGWRPYVVDPRGFFARPDRFPDAEEVVAAWPEEAFERIGGIDRATSIAVLTHDPKLDDAALGIALRSDAAYVGAMGSRRAQEKRRDRLVAQGLTEEEIAPAERADRPGPRRAHARGDRAVDHGRDRGPPPRPRGRPAVAPARRAHPRGHRLIGGVVLAAGGASRFGSPKQLAELDGVALLQHAVDAMLAVPAVDPIVVVLGAEAARVREAVDFGDARAIECADWQAGMAASLRCGVEAVGDCDWVLVTLGDQPRVTPQVIAAVMDHAESAPAGTAAVRATYDGVARPPRGARACDPPAGGTAARRRRGT